MPTANMLVAWQLAYEGCSSTDMIFVENSQHEAVRHEEDSTAKAECLTLEKAFTSRNHSL